ncbi:4'-phosphopantetheinyl transferase family protein [Kutzneria albida]|uniref:4'-phosphopantetheinyl transferase n=1 Tax=Kutzneria albida DSM 43870 TaxID=1449976 RepID=W5W819_9PSEU|nr:4'-phosphopantetheinyl transferase superfamily protein [Kutzneria albida]AHH96885.1 4'-phosphopantetheinyl transferase [Kutzneria albida DSM 43870]
MIEDVLPGQVVSCDVLGEDPDARLLPEEEPEVAKAVDKRVREFTIARTCARRALGKLGFPEVPILRGHKRQPLWPEGIVGAITHTKGYCAAAVARSREVLTVGIDAEVHDTLPEGVLDVVTIEPEREWLAGAPDTGVHWDRLLFSAKESVYKAWFPLTGLWLGFTDAHLTFDPAAQTFHATLLVDPPEVAGRPLTGFDGRYLVREGLVLTAIAVPA